MTTSFTVVFDEHESQDVVITCDKKIKHPTAMDIAEILYPNGYETLEVEDIKHIE